MKPTLQLFLLSALALLAGCARGAKLTVVNRSTADLTNVVATGTGFFQPVGSIPAGGQRQVRVRPSGESGLQLDFDADGRHFTTPRDGYFEDSSHYRLTAIVAPDFTVTVTSAL